MKNYHRRVDLKIYHQSNSSYITNATGNLNIGSNNEVRIKGGSDVAESMALFTDDGAVELYYKNEKVVSENAEDEDDNFFSKRKTVYIKARSLKYQSMQV